MRSCDVIQWCDVHVICSVMCTENSQDQSKHQNTQFSFNQNKTEQTSRAKGIFYAAYNSHKFTIFISTVQSAIVRYVLNQPTRFAYNPTIQHQT